MGSAPRSKIRPTPLQPLATLAYREFAARDPALVAEISERRAQWKQALSQLRGLPRRRQHSRVRQLLRSQQFGLFHAYRGALKARRIHTATRQSLEAMAERLDPFSPCDELAMRRVIVKDGRTRSVANYGPNKRALQHMVADLIRATNPPRANQFLFNGGIPAALVAVEAAYARGLTHTVELDVESFYRNLPRECLAGLLRPLPDAVVDHVVWDLSIRVTGDDVADAIWSRGVAPPLNGSQGLSLGSASSPVVGEVVIGRLLAANEIDFGPDIITYADNLLVLGRSEQEAEARAENLTALALEPVYGSLRLREKGRGHFLPVASSPGGFARGVPFAGQFGNIGSDGSFSWEPTPERQLRHRIAEGERCPSQEELERAQGRVSAFHRAYPRWADRDVREAEERARLSSAIYLQAPSPEKLAAAGRDLVFALLLNRGQGQFLEEMVPEYLGIETARRDRLLQECNSLIERLQADGQTEQAA